MLIPKDESGDYTITYYRYPALVPESASMITTPDDIAANATSEQLKEAAELANVAIVDMSDNANKMGTSMEMIQNAYQGFAKGNMTMLDNLKLGRLHYCRV